MRIPIHTYRTHNRNRSLSFTNSDQLVNVNKGSRQFKPVTLGKRLALMIEHQGNLVLNEYHYKVKSRDSSQDDHFGKVSR
jgi:hypothetical protein